MDDGASLLKVIDDSCVVHDVSNQFHRIKISVLIKSTLHKSLFCVSLSPGTQPTSPGDSRPDAWPGVKVVLDFLPESQDFKWKFSIAAGIRASEVSLNTDGEYLLTVPYLPVLLVVEYAANTEQMTYHALP
ncbi:hypothetical protein Ddc_00014 [Ditylenchus destructor]|nr:hypothetical protein Ddc_00014 [Ditylenchus destructor]